MGTNKLIGQVRAGGDVTCPLVASADLGLGRRIFFTIGPIIEV